VDAYGKSVARFLIAQFIEHGLDHAGCELLGRQAAASADHHRQGLEPALAAVTVLRQSAAGVLVQGVAVGAGFALHFDDVRYRAPQVGLTAGRPGVGQLTLRRCGGDGIDGTHVAESMGDAGCGFVTVDGGLPGCHYSFQPEVEGLRIGRHRRGRYR
jgi:hypothetical protein